jgi:dipeptidyl aminopeptidase/acylaminoacyl peptidase
LIFQAENDGVISLAQSEALYNRLKEFGVPASLIIVQNAQHCFPSSNLPLVPTREEISRLIGDFFDETMKK